MPRRSLTLAALAPSAVPGQRLQVTLGATDDVGVAAMSVLARLSPQGGGSVRGLLAATRPIVPSVMARQEVFEVVVPADAQAGSVVTIEASAADTGGQSVTAPVVSISVADTQGPTLTVGGATAGQRITAGQALSIVVSAQDPAGVARLGLRTTGVLVRTDERPVSPALPSAATTFAARRAVHRDHRRPTDARSLR